MSPVNETPVIEEDFKQTQPPADTTKKREAETETTESKDTSKPAKKRRKKERPVEDTRETAEAEAVEMERRSTPEVTVPQKPPHDTNFQPAENGNALREVSEKKEKKKEKEVRGEGIKGG